MSDDREPVDTMLPWARPRRDPMTQVDFERYSYEQLVRKERAEYERRAREAMTKPGNGEVHPMSITTPTYEPNRAMVPRDVTNGIIQKKGMKPPGADDIRTPDLADRLVVWTVVVCLILMAAVVGYMLTKLG